MFKKFYEYHTSLFDRLCEFLFKINKKNPANNKKISINSTLKEKINECV